MSICGYLRVDGTSCPLKASKKTPDGKMFLCGMHYKVYCKKNNLVQETETVDNAAASSKPKKPTISPAIKKEIKKQTSNTKEMYKNIKQFIENKDKLITLDDDQMNVVLNLEELLDAEEFDIVIMYALKHSSSTQTKINFQSIANNIPNAYFGLKKSKMVEKRPIKIKMEMFPYRRDVSLLSFEEKIPNDKIIQLSDLNNSVFQHFTDVDVKIINCKFIDDIGEWNNQELNIYMGPGVYGHPIDSEWYIPFEEKYCFREEQNKKDVERIMEKIKNGEEKKEKYLSLKGKTLGSLCMPESCHCEVYVEVLRRLKKIDSDDDF